jgi:hypothetical protein
MSRGDGARCGRSSWETRIIRSLVSSCSKVVVPDWRPFTTDRWYYTLFARKKYLKLEPVS